MCLSLPGYPVLLDMQVRNGRIDCFKDFRFVHVAQIDFEGLLDSFERLRETYMYSASLSFVLTK